MQITYLGIVARVTEEGLMETARMIQIVVVSVLYDISQGAQLYTDATLYDSR